MTPVKILLAVFIIATLLLSYLLISRSYSCGNFISNKFEVIYPDDSKKCDYIILKRKNEKVLSWISKKKTDSSDKANLKAKPIDTAEAIKYIRWYNEKHNPHLKNSSFIDMDRKEMLLYLIDVASVTKNDISNICRIYLADRSGVDTTHEISAVVTAKTDNGEIYLNYDQLKPLDWGSLCPPPYQDCINKKYAFLLQRAIWSSTKLSYATRTVQKP
jgi:hypothetical protein